MSRAVTPMFVVRLIGGLGNQMFQYALGRALAAKYGVPLKLDVSGFREYTLHSYALDALDIVGECATDEELKELRKIAESGSVLGRLLGKSRTGVRWVRERSFTFDLGVLDAAPPAYLDGYWQSERYFASSSQILRKEFQLRRAMDRANQEIAARMAASESVALHVRRGDYVSNLTTNAVHGVCGPDYYQRAISLALERLINPCFFVFSDDLAWARENLPTAGSTVFVDLNDASRSYMDLHLISKCRHQIIANSTFSWWGAWLNPNPDKIVIAPLRWFKRDDMDTRDLIPESWQKV